MKTFAIDEKNQVLVFASKKEAAAASVTDAFTNQSELAELTAEWPMQRLIGIWNSLPGVTPVSKFTSRKIAIERLWKAIQGFETSAKPEPAVPETTAAEPTAPAESVPEPQAADDEQQEAPAAMPASDEPQATAEEPTQVAEPVAIVSASVADVAPAAESPNEEPTPAKRTRKTSRKPKTENQESGPREGSKTAQVVAMLQREGGASISEIMNAMGWQKHTVRGFMAGTMKKAGYTVESFKPEGGERSYRIRAK